MNRKSGIKIILIAFLLLGIAFLLVNVFTIEGKAQPEAGVNGTTQVEDDGGLTCSGKPHNC